MRGAYIRLLNDDNGIELARYTLEQVTESETAMIFGEVYRNPKGWKFRAVGQGYASGLHGVVGPAGMNGDNLPTARPVDVMNFLRRASPARNQRSPPSTSSADGIPDLAASSTEATRPSLPGRTLPASRPSPTPAPKPAPKPAAKAAPPPAHRLPSRPPSGRRRPGRPRRPKPRRAGRTRTLIRARCSTSASPSRPRRHHRRGQRAVAANGPPIVFGEHSSRYRQRTEHVRRWMTTIPRRSGPRTTAGPAA